MVLDRRGPAVGGESSTSDRKKFPRRGRDALSIFLLLPVRAACAARSAEAAHSSCASIHEIFLSLSVLVTNRQRRRQRAEDTKRDCGAKHQRSRPLPRSVRRSEGAELEIRMLILDPSP